MSMKKEHDAPVEELALRDYIRICWKRKWLIALVTLVAAVAAYVLSDQRTRVYQASAKVFIGPRAALQGDVSSALEELTFSNQFVVSYAELMRSRPLAERVIEREALNVTPSALSSRIKTRIVPDTRIIEVSVADTSPDRAERIVNTLVNTFVGQVVEEFGGRAGVSAKVFEPAITPRGPVSPRPRRDGALGGILGMMLGVALAFVREQLDTTIRSREDVERSLAPLPVLASIPERGKNAPRELVMTKDPNAPAAEAFRILRASIHFLGVERPLRRIMVTSPSVEEGKTTVAVNLAASLAAAGHKVLLIEADLRRPTARSYFDLPPSPGLTGVLVGSSSLADAVLETPIKNLSVLLAGQYPPNPAELLGSRSMVRLLDEASASYGLVIIDTPPALPVADPTVLAPHTDGVVLVARAGRTHRGRAREVVTTFERIGVRIFGVVLNGAATSESPYNYYYSSNGTAEATSIEPVNVEPASRAAPLDAPSATGTGSAAGPEKAKRQRAR